MANGRDNWGVGVGVLLEEIMDDGNYISQGAGYPPAFSPSPFFTGSGAGAVAVINGGSEYDTAGTLYAVGQPSFGYYDNDPFGEDLSAVAANGGNSFATGQGGYAPVGQATLANQHDLPQPPFGVVPGYPAFLPHLASSDIGNWAVLISVLGIAWYLAHHKG